MTTAVLAAFGFFFAAHLPALAQAPALETMHAGCNSTSRSRDPDCVAAIHRFCSQTGHGGAGISQEVAAGVFGVACFAPSWYGDVPLSQLTQQHPGCNQINESQTSDCMAAVHRWCSANKDADGGVAQEVGASTQSFGVACFKAAWSGDKPIGELTSFHPGCNSVSKSESSDCLAAIHRSCSAAGQGSAGLVQEVGANALRVSCLHASWHGDVLVRGTDVPTTRRSATRDGVYYASGLTTSNVGALYKKWAIQVDDKIYAQPLVVGSVATPSGNRDVVYVATSASTLYAFDAQDPTTRVWGPVTLVEHPVMFTDDFVAGILGTPAIDVENNAMYVVAQSCRSPIAPDPENINKCGQTYPATKSQMKNCLPGNSVHTLFKVDIRDGTITSQVPIEANDQNGFAFDSSLHLQRTGLLFVNKRVYVGFGGQQCDFGNNHGWLLAYDANLKRCSAFNATPDTRLGGIWQSGAGVAADAAGNVYVETGNGDPKQQDGDFASGILKFPPPGDACSGGAPPEPLAYLADNWAFLNKQGNDLDLGSSGPVVISSGRLIAGSKQGRIYVLDRHTMRGTHPQATCNLDCPTFLEDEPEDSKCFGGPLSAHPHIHGSPVWWDERSQIFVWGEHDYLRRLTLTPSGTLVPPPLPLSGPSICGTNESSYSSSVRAPFWKGNGGVPSLSIGGDGSAILWATIEETGDGDPTYHPPRLFAFDAEHPDLKLLWSNEWTPSDGLPRHGKFVPPTVFNGNVYVATWQNELAVYGIRDTQSSLWFDITKPGLDATGWGFEDTNTVAWAQGARAADIFCSGKLFTGGQLNGYKGLDNNRVMRAGVICNGTSRARHFDSADADRSGSAWKFSDVNTIGWAQASRLADEYCKVPARKFTGGQFNGQQSAPNGLMGIVCYQGTWFDVPKSQVTLSKSDLNLVDWGEAARAANDWCKSHGHPLGGRFNGWQSQTAFGTVCY